MKPQDAACIIEADVNVDFDAPVGYKEPERKPIEPQKVILPEVNIIGVYVSIFNMSVLFLRPKKQCLWMNPKKKKSSQLLQELQ